MSRVSGVIRSRLSVVAIALLSSGIVGSSYAGTRTGVYNWNRGDTISPGQMAVTCTFTWSDLRPFQIPRTLVVDNTAPAGTVLHSWAYGEFADYQYNCTGGVRGSSSTYASSTRAISASVRASGQFNDEVGFISPGGYVFSTSVPGIGLKIYATPYYHSDFYSETTRSATLTIANAQGSAPYDSGVEYGTNVQNNGVFEIFFGMISPHYNDSVNGHYYQFHDTSVSVSLRAELIKTGTITASDYGRPVSLSMRTSKSVFSQTSSQTGDVYSSQEFSGSGITLASPACMLNNENYDVNMGDWVAYTWGGSVRRGDEKLVDISLKCTGAANNVYFRFEDAGSATASTDKNIRVYKSAGSGTDVVDGLEIELLYNGEHVDVDGTTLTNIGTRGSYVSTNNNETQIYSSQSAARFTARFLQNGQISYLGPVTGKVNMWVTYE
ncbi:TPA: hypothetical protein I8372_001252 [Citrobacter farmeri]|nr:hypothetical protein [Citrobacter farmeri]HAT2776154.1 hypothetical protein [Citrobacter farmeri]HAT2807119.1 hypothetical protein [Citrobacter farmeri]HBC0546933.1 hypothetical protein [Citrobacter farmeri]